MKSIRTLIKLSKNQLDKIIIELNELEEEKTAWIAKLNLIVEESSKETEAYHGSEYSFMLEKYLNYIQKKQAAITLQLQRLESYIEKKREVLRDGYSELKKYEIILQSKQKDEVKKAQKAETNFLDDFPRNLK